MDIFTTLNRRRRRFVREVLGCGCDDDVLAAMQPLAIDDESLAGRIGGAVSVGGRLMVLAVDRDAVDDVVLDPSEVLERATAARDAGGFARVRVILPVAPAAVAELEARLAEVRGGLDDRTFVHVVPEAEVERAGLAQGRDARRTLLLLAAFVGVVGALYTAVGGWGLAASRRTADMLVAAQALGVPEAAAIDPTRWARAWTVGMAAAFVLGLASIAAACALARRRAWGLWVWLAVALALPVLHVGWAVADGVQGRGTAVGTIEIAAPATVALWSWWVLRRPSLRRVLR